MQDRFKFRGLAKNNEWCYGSLLWYAGEPQIWEQDGKNYIVKPETVGQCTGLKDKNGTLIYEGDIVKFKTELFGKPKQIIWDECHYILKDTFIILCDMEIKQFGLEVIGNIYDNPELLGVEMNREQKERIKVKK